MPTSKAQIRATNRYIAKAYDRLSVFVPKGRKSDLDRVIGRGKVNGEINDFLRRRVGMSEEEWKQKPDAGDPDG